MQDKFEFKKRLLFGLYRPFSICSRRRLFNIVGKTRKLIILRIYILFILIIKLLGCTSNSNPGNDDGNSALRGNEISTNFKSTTNQAYEQVSMQAQDFFTNKLNNQSFPYLDRDTLFVLEGENSMINKIPIQLPDFGTLKKYHKQLDSIYYVKQVRIDNKLFISVGLKNTEFDPSNFVLVDIISKKVVLNITADCFDTYIGSSENGLYHLIESGTVPCGRDVRIYNTNSMLVKQVTYNNCVDDTNQLSWSGNMFYYWDTYNPNIKIPDTLPDLKQYEQYMQKYYWVNGEDSITEEFKVLFSPM